MEIARSFQEAAKAYHDNPTALHLRAMNMLYEGLKEKGALMLVPSSAVESMGMGGLLGAAALRQQRLTGGRALLHKPNEEMMRWIGQTRSAEPSPPADDRAARRDTRDHRVVSVRRRELARALSVRK